MHKAGELELASVLMPKNVNKRQNVDACLLFLASANLSWPCIIDQTR